MRRKKWKWILGIAITLLSLALALRQVDVPNIVTAFRGANYLLLGVAFGLIITSTISTVTRWRVLLGRAPVGLGPLFRVFMIAHVFNVVYPAKLGTFLRAHLVGEMSDLNKGFVLGTVFGEKILDNAAGLCLILLLLPLVPSPPWLHRVITAGATTLLAAVIVSALLFWFRGHWLPELVWRVKVFQHSWVETISTYFSRGLEGLGTANRPGTRLSVFLLTVGVTAINWLVAQVALWALGIQVSWVAAPLLLVVLEWGTDVPSVPGNIGVFHYLCVLTLRIFSVEPSLAFSYGVVLHVLWMVMPTFIGLACLWPARIAIWS